MFKVQMDHRVHKELQVETVEPVSKVNKDHRVPQDKTELEQKDLKVPKDRKVFKVHKVAQVFREQAVADLKDLKEQLVILVTQVFKA